MELTSQQSVIIEADFRDHILVHAGPGTGKTEVVARRLNHLLGVQQLKTDQILVLSFSRAAVKALIQRIRQIRETDTESVEDLRYLSVRTFDSWSFRMLRFMGEAPTSLLRNAYEENIALLVKKLSISSREELLGNHEFRLHRIRHIIVDECQDLTGVRAKLVQTLLEKLVPSAHDGTDSPRCGVTILGDPNQAIYGWMLDDSCGDAKLSSQELLSWVRKTYSPVLKIRALDINHRATSQLCDLVIQAAVILSESEKQFTDPRPELRRLVGSWTDVEDSEDVVRDIQLSNNGSRLAILCRDNSQIINLHNELKRKLEQDDRGRITVTTGDPPKLLPSWIATMLYKFKTETLSRGHFIKIFKHFVDSDSFRPPYEGDPDLTWQLLMRFAHQGEDDTAISMEKLRTRLNWPDSLPDDENCSEDSILITTIHQAKGLEFERVKLLERADEKGKVDVQEEGRVLFVALSRAKHELSLLDMPTYEKFFHREFERGRRKRWYCHGRKGLNLLELGQKDDLDLEAIVRSDVQGDEEIVKYVQQFLTENEQDLNGREVLLNKTPVPKEFYRHP